MAERKSQVPETEKEWHPEGDRDKDAGGRRQRDKWIKHSSGF